MGHPRFRLLALGLAGLSFACDDPFAGLLQPVPEVPGEASLTDLRTGALEDPSAFDLLIETPVRPDLTGAWDFLYRIESGQPQLVPFNALADSASDAGLQPVTDSFEGVRTAPSSGYVQEEPVAIAEGDVLVARSRRDPNQFFTCRRFAKIEILDIDAAGARVTFRYLVNPNCDDRVLVPGQHGEP